ncbi:hypothetical protein PHLCEN_2v98 [Hermanssonia centrifuga]|uniref:Protein kinase domain-containing protein n=1 Tax=Hermanssonia centrifuga TaxID=98765 RepID=A0A2R6S708_9APHY|nr:hypothetical protein PHLCEN_2v98 [Hermanssonia centrifuga]
MPEHSPPPGESPPGPEGLPPDKEATKEGRGSTPMRASCEVMRDHKTDSVHPFVQQDLEDTLREVSVDTWIEAVLGVPPDRLNEWATLIKKLGWFRDRTIERALTDYARPAQESGIYKPFARIANQILELAKGALPGVGASYPIADIEVVVNDPISIERIPEHGELGAFRKPDLLFVRGSQKDLSGGNGARVRWVDILAFMEFKLDHKEQLLQTLNTCRDDRGLPTIKSKDVKPSKPKKNTKKPAPKRRPARIVKVALVSSDRGTSGPSSAGSKRSIDDVLDGDTDQLRSSSKKQKTESSNVNVETIRKNVQLQAGGYALELASCTYGTRVFSLGSIVRDDKMSLWYYDASGYVRTEESVSVMKDFEKFAAIMVAFACGEPKHWGALPDIISPPSSTPYPASFPPPSLKGHSLEMVPPDTKEPVKVTLGKPVFTQYGLVGRRTFLYRIKTNTVVAQTPLVIKFSYQVVSRKREQDLVEVARKAGVKHIPKVHMWRDLWKLSDGARAIFHGDKKGVYEDKMLRALVYTRYIPLKALFKTAWHLIPHMADQILDCLHDLRYKSNMLHRDISANNVMFEVRDGAVKFVVIDFDLAAMVDSNGEPLAAPSSKHRTGTLPFMAYELLRDMAKSTSSEHQRIVHRLRHDFESLFYLCLYCLLTMVEVEDAKIKADMTKELRDWEDQTYSSIASSKQYLCTDIENMGTLVLPVPCQVLRPWFYGWVTVFQRADLAMSNYKNQVRLAQWYKDESSSSFDIDTLQGTITRDKIKQSLGFFYDRPLAPEDLQVANIPGLGKKIEAYMDDDEDLAEEDGHVQGQSVVVKKAKPPRKPRSTTKVKKVEVAKKKTVPKTVVASKKTTTAELVGPIRKQTQKPKRGVRTLAAATRSMTTRSMQKGALAKAK